MRLLVAILALPLGVQDRLQDISVPKQRRSAYISRVNTLREAEAALERDPAECVEKCTQIIENKEIEDGQKEVRLRIEHARGGWGEWIPFMPYQLRGRALLARAEAMSSQSRVVAVDLVTRAIEDFKKSVSRGARSSAPHLEKAEALLGRLAAADRPPAAVPPAPGTPPPPAVREEPRTVEQILEQIKRLKEEIERLKSKIEKMEPRPEDAKPPAKKEGP